MIGRPRRGCLWNTAELFGGIRPQDVIHVHQGGILYRSGMWMEKGNSDGIMVVLDGGFEK